MPRHIAGAKQNSVSQFSTESLIFAWIKKHQRAAPSNLPIVTAFKLGAVVRKIPPTPPHTTQ